MPWGDDGDMLLSGMTAHLDQEDGLLQLERTGPLVPPITITGIDATGYSQIVVTEVSQRTTFLHAPTIKQSRIRWVHCGNSA